MAQISETEFQQGYRECPEADLILVDTKEPTKVFDLLGKEGIKHKRVDLPVGDFVYGRIAVERKTIQDFVQSIQKGHLQKQLIEIQNNFDIGYLIISGHLKDLKYGNWTINHHLGALSSIAVRYPKIKILQVDNDSQLIKLVQKICEKQYDGKTPDIIKTELMKIQLTSDDIRLKMLTCIPGISFGRAKLLRPFVDISLINKQGNLIQEKHLLALENVGKSTVSVLMNFNKTSPTRPDILD